MRTLLLMRHAKSDWNASYGRDHDRPLNGRGVRSARIVGRLIAQEEVNPAVVVTSTALRARTTAEIASDAGDWRADIRLEPLLYGSGADTAVQVTAEAPDVERLMLVGHQPTWSRLAAILTGESVEMKTATVAVIDFDIDVWADVSACKGEVRTVYQPGDYMGSRFDTD